MPIAPIQDRIIVRGAREHNLKDLTLDMPKNALVVITGLSGSGKSTLAFDTLYAEGQRRYVESLSAYARQFLGQLNKPDVDAIEGLSPAIAIEQKAASKNPRSTVGTVTEIFDYLRLLYARVGVPHCPACGKKLESQSTQSIVEQVLKKFDGKPVTVYAPVVRGKKGTYEKQLEELQKKGFSRVRVDGFNYTLPDDEGEIKLDKYVKHFIDASVDRFIVGKGEESRLTEAIERAAEVGNGFITVSTQKKDTLYSKKLSCEEHEISFDELEPRMFSFNSPFGACTECHGIGYHRDFDEKLIIPDQTLSVLDGAIAVPGFRSLYGWRGQQLAALARHFKMDLRTPWKHLSKKHREILLHGSDEQIDFKYVSADGDSQYTGKSTFEGVIPINRRLYRETKSNRRREEMEKYMVTKQCAACGGQRLKPLSLAVKIGGKNIMETSDFTIAALRGFFKGLSLSKQQIEISRQVLKEIGNRLRFLSDVGLDYLTLSRSANTLSGGEAQRIRLATQIGSNLTGVLYVLDEPSIGLHQRDNTKLIATLQKLRDLGNTVIVVEHDEETILCADHVVDIGPGAGIHGGHIVAQGTPKQVMADSKSLTGQYLAGKAKINYSKQRRAPKGWLELEGASQHNLKDLAVRFPLGVMCGVTGVSGSGKSTLIGDTLYPLLSNRLYHSEYAVGKFSKLKGLDQVDKVINIDQSPIGRTPRSNPATYTGVFTPVRALFAATRDAKIRGFDAGRFSFNVDSGRCEKCEGNGTIKIEMNFLPDVYITCEECHGTRYNRETLSVLYKGKNIAQVLDMTVEEAHAFFRNVPAVRRRLETLMYTGLGYIRLGQSATTLSGGEAQRVKLSSELSKMGTGKTLYILDEPTTGLHFDDVKKLLGVLNSLVEKGNTVLVIEHNLDVVKSADWLIDLGPEGGDAGGEIVAEGTPEAVARNKKSYTGQYLKPVLER